jgi:hypothetical protein
VSATHTADEWRYLRAACAVVLVLVVAELAGWLVYRSSPHGPSALERTEKCLRQEKLLQIEPVASDPVAGTARGGALATRVEGNGVHVVIAKSDDEAAKLADEYRRTAGREIEVRLDVRGRVLYVWEEAREPTPTQRQTMYDCWYE